MPDHATRSDDHGYGGSRRLCAVPASASTGWTIQPTPAVTNSGLQAVSCPLATSCTAVGSAGSSATQPLAEHWNGTTWTIQATASPQVNKTLNGISCLRSSACTAVGYYTATLAHQTIQALAERR